jgi:hypothetical protein
MDIVAHLNNSMVNVSEMPKRLIITKVMIWWPLGKEHSAIFNGDINEN